VRIQIELDVVGAGDRLLASRRVHTHAWTDVDVVIGTLLVHQSGLVSLLANDDGDLGGELPLREERKGQREGRGRVRGRRRRINRQRVPLRPRHFGCKAIHDPTPRRIGHPQLRRDTQRHARASFRCCAVGRQ
jgi:hypothetical protein